MRLFEAHFLLMCIFVASNRSLILNLYTMKKFTLALMAVLAISFSLKAQQYVSTTPSNRNVILEEFTGRNCGYCTDGHRIGNEIMAEFPGRFWAINVHTGGYAPTSYPNMNTTDGTTIASGFSISGYPTGNVNRNSATCQDRGQWRGLAVNQMGQAAECNIGGMVVVNPASRLATITVEVYYTGNSSVGENYLTVAMLQDSILGSQADYGNYNPTQWVGSQYCHMHIFRDVVNSTSAWGDPISPTTQGTLITRTYTYEIPEVIGSPNGVEVDLDNIMFLAWVTERFQGTPTRPVLTANELEMVQGSDEPIYPFIKTVAQQAGTTCSHTKIVEARIQNGGTETLTSMTFEAEIEGQITTINWEGELAQYGLTTVEIPVEVPFGSHNVEVRITQANGHDYEFNKTASVNCMEWADLQIEGTEEELKLELMQDKFGNQITWEATASDGSVIASGGPYAMLAGGTATQIHMEYFNVPANECVKFTIYDNIGNGICCAYGHGYFILYDSNNNAIFGDEDDGEFGSEATILLSVKGENQVHVGETEVDVLNYTDANFVSYLDYEGYPDDVGFQYQKEGGELQTVVGIINEFQDIFAEVNNLEASSTYTVKAYAVIDGETYFGEPTTFDTWTEGVNELENSLKLYPNPASEVLNLVGEGMNKVEIYNAMGQCVIAEEVNGTAAISTSALCNGIYFVRIYAQNGEMVTRNFSVVR